MFKLPLSPINTFRSRAKVAVAKNLIGNNDRFIEMHIPGLIDPQSIQITLKSIEANKYVLVTGEHLDEKYYRDGMWHIEQHRVATFCEQYVVPANAVNPVPKATLTLAKDTCGNVSEGVLRIEWETAETNVPIEIKDCSPDDPV